MKIGYLGTGAWGFCLATLLAQKKYKVISWDINENLINTLKKTNKHPSNIVDLVK